MSKRQTRNVGDVVLIGLLDGFHAYARVMKEAVFAVYDAHVPDAQDLPIDVFNSLPILFYVAVMDHAVKRGRWRVIGHIPSGSSSQDIPPAFIQDPIDKRKFSIYQDGQIRSATREECIGFERCAVWDPEHVEDRIRDYYAGVSNKWVESLKIKN